MAVELVLRNGTAAENDAFTGALAEVTVDKTNNTLRVHDGSTPGGTPLLTGASSGATLTDITLAGTTTVSGQIDSDLIPSSDITYDLGSPTNRWNDLYLSGNTIDIGGATISVVGGSFAFKDSGGNDAEVSLAANTTDDLAEGTTNLYAAQPVGTTDDVTFNSVTVDGDLTVNGTTTTLNTTTLDVEDINITVANGAADATAADGAGLTIDLGTDGTADFTYDSGNDRLASNKSIAADLVGNVTGTVSDISNHDTDDLSEGTTNLYYTDTRVRNAVSASGDLSYNSTTGTFSFTERTDAEVRGLVSAAGDLSYNSTTGEFSVTTFKSSDFDSNFAGKSTTDLSEGTNLYYTDARVDAHLSGGSGIDFSTGTISHSDTSTVTDVTASSNTFVDALTFDGFGHVTAVSTSTAAPPNDATITVSAGSGLTGGGNFTTDQSINETISLDVDTSTIATRSYVDTEVANLVDSSPTTLDTLNELAAALGDDPNFATTVSNDIGTKVDKTTTISAGSGLTGGGDLSANRTISHADTSSQGSVNGSGNTFIQDVTLDGFGHVTGLATNTLTTGDLGLDTNDDVRFDSLGIGTTASGTSGEIRATNNITAFYSDERLKDFIGPIDSALNKISHIGGYYFTENQTAKDLGYDNQERQVGVNAQEVQKVLPEVVKTAPISYNDDVDTNYLTVQYEKLVPLLIEAMKEQQQQINELKTKVYK